MEFEDTEELDGAISCRNDNFNSPINGRKYKKTEKKKKKR